MKVGITDSCGNTYFIDVTIEDIAQAKLTLHDKWKILRSKKHKVQDEEINFMNEIWAAKAALDNAESNLEGKITRISLQEGSDASRIFSQTDDRQKFESLFQNGGMTVSIDDLLKLYNSLTGRGKEELNRFIKSK